MSQINPIPIQIDVTNACNLRCSHCYHPNHSNFGVMSFERWKFVINQYAELLLEKNASSDVIICGGEPLTSPITLPLIEMLTSLWPTGRISILTNGTLLNEERLKRLIPYIANLDFQISFDGHNAASHDFYRGKGSFQKSVLGMQSLKKFGFKYSVCTVLTQRNCEQVEEFFLFALREQIPQLSFTRFVSMGYGKNLVSSGSDQVPSAQELKSAYQNIVFFSAATNVETNLSSALFAILNPRLGGSRFDNAMVIDSTGKILITSRSRLQIGHISTDRLVNVFNNNPLLRALRENLIDSCKGCELLTRCGGDRNAALAATGDFLGKDPGCWKTNKTA